MNDDEEPSEQLLKDLKISEEDEKAGRILSFNSPKELLTWLDRKIKKSKSE